MTPLELINATKAFNGHRAVDDLSFSINPGEIVGFLGPNGAGKSTSLRIALGIIEADQGEARLFGAPPSLRSLQNIGFLPEERGLYRRMTTEKVITFFARLKGLTKADARDRAVELLDKHGLADHKKTRISKLSKGMAQKVQIIAAIAHSPKLIILDEPFSGLDPVNQQDLETLIRNEHAKGATILFSTHVMEHAERLCDRLVIIGAGKKRFDGTLDEAINLVPASATIQLSNDFALNSALASHGFNAEREASMHSQSQTDTPNTSWSVDIPKERTVQDLLRIAVEVGAPITAFTPRQTRLRDVFVELTGDTALVSETTRDQLRETAS